MSLGVRTVAVPSPATPGMRARPLRPFHPTHQCPFVAKKRLSELNDRIYGADCSNAGSRDQRGRAARGSRDVDSRVAGSAAPSSAVRNTWHHWLDLRRSAAGGPTSEGVIKSDDCQSEFRRISPIQANLARIIAELPPNSPELLLHVQRKQNRE